MIKNNFHLLTAMYTVANKPQDEFFSHYESLRLPKSANVSQILIFKFLLNQPGSFNNLPSQFTNGDKFIYFNNVRPIGISPICYKTNFVLTPDVGKTNSFLYKGCIALSI